jgi:hypothetical protein
VTDSALGGTSKNNLITNTGANACNLSNGVNGNIVGSSPNLGALANNGGSTLTFAVLAGSPAIDAGDDSSCPSTDQRGATRPQGLHCDIGAYESSFSAPPPAGHTILSFSLNGGGNAVTVPGSSSVTVDYTYQVWGDSSMCPGCNYQLVWGLENNWQYCSAWTSPSPGDFPGLSGTGSQFNITAPVTPGTYTIYSFSGQYADCTAAIAAYTSAGGTAQGTIEVLGPSVVLYEGGTSAGNIGPRASADAICAANLPPGYGNYHAFIGYSAVDSIANMPAIYGIPTNIPIRSASNVLIANNWVDLVDGTIATQLTSAGVTSSNYWWSGVDDASGIHTDGVTDDCTDWTSNLNATPGSVGWGFSIVQSWMFYSSNVACDQAYAILCVGY